MFVAVGLFLLLLSTNCGHAFPPEWAMKIVQLCTEFQNHPTCFIITINFPAGSSAQTPLSYLVPPVLLWSPQEQFKLKFFCPKCMHEKCMIPVGWRDGTNDRLIPRRIHGVDSSVLLVGRLYKCENSHVILGYDPGILSQLPTMDMVPFRLWHKTGATKELIDLIQSSISIGCSVNAVTTMMIQKRYSAYARRVNVLNKMLPKSDLVLPTFEEWSSHSPSIGPSRHFVSACFLLQFWEREHLYCRHMQSLSLPECNSWLSCDHTFSSAGELVNNCMISFLLFPYT